MKQGWPIPATETLSFGARCPAQIHAAVFCGTAAAQANTAGPGLGHSAGHDAQACMGLGGWVSVLRGQEPGDVVKHIWCEAASFWQVPVQKCHWCSAFLQLYSAFSVCFELLLSSAG